MGSGSRNSIKSLDPGKLVHLHKLLVSLGPLPLLQAAHIQLQNVHFLAQQASHARGGPAQVAVDELLDVGPRTRPDLKDGAVSTDEVQLQSMDELFPDHEGPPVQHSERGELHEGKILLALQPGLVLLCQLRGAVDVAEVVLDLVHLCGLELHAYVGLGGLHEAGYLHELVLVVDEQLEEFGDPPGVELLLAQQPLLLPPPFKLPLYFGPTLLARQAQHLLLRDGADGTDRVLELQHKGPPTLQHPHIDVLPPACVELDLEVGFRPAGEEQGEDAVLDLLLEATLRQLLAIYHPGRLRKVPRKLDIPPAKIHVFGQQCEGVGDLAPLAGKGRPLSAADELPKLMFPLEGGEEVLEVLLPYLGDLPDVEGVAFVALLGDDLNPLLPSLDFILLLQPQQPCQLRHNVRLRLLVLVVQLYRDSEVVRVVVRSGPHGGQTAHFAGQQPLEDTLGLDQLMALEGVHQQLVVKAPFLLRKVLGRSPVDVPLENETPQEEHIGDSDVELELLKVLKPLLLGLRLHLRTQPPQTAVLKYLFAEPAFLHRTALGQVEASQLEGRLPLLLPKQPGQQLQVELGVAVQAGVVDREYAEDALQAGPVVQQQGTEQPPGLPEPLEGPLVADEFAGQVVVPLHRDVKKQYRQSHLENNNS